MPFTFDPSTGRYHDSVTGALIPEAGIRKALDQVLSGSAEGMRVLTQSLIDGRMTLAGWQMGMMAEIKSAQLVGATLAIGGWSAMDATDFGWVGQRIRSQYAYLRGFAADIAAGRQKLDGTALSRASMYAESARATHRAAQTREAIQRGEEQERNVLGFADHCVGCLSATAAGWVPIGTLPSPGMRNCLSRCHCYLDYRAKVTARAA